jgi:hypothetical protein
VQYLLDIFGCDGAIDGASSICHERKCTCCLVYSPRGMQQFYVLFVGEIIYGLWKVKSPQRCATRLICLIILSSIDRPTQYALTVHVRAASLFSARYATDVGFYSIFQVRVL